MPSTRITTSFMVGDKKRQWCDAFQGVLVETLKIGTNDRLIIVDERPEGFFHPGSAGSGYVLVEITLFPGRPVETKRLLYRRIVELLEVFGVEKANTRVILNEVSPENWGIRGGQAGCDVIPAPKGK